MDPTTGTVRLDAVIGVDDVGIAVNPLLLEGQLMGAIAQAAGQALKEKIVHDDNGQLLTGSYTDYAMPHAADFPRFKLGLRPVRPGQIRWASRAVPNVAPSDCRPLLSRRWWMRCARMACAIWICRSRPCRCGRR